MLKRAAWVALSIVQFIWMASFIIWMFFYSLTIAAITWRTEPAMGTARTFFGPVNIPLGFSKLTIAGRENFPLRPPYLIMMNHQSMADIMFGWMAPYHAVRFVGKRALMFVPVIGWVMWAFGMVGIDRSNVVQATRSLKKAALILKQKRRVIMVFPEGTRTNDGKIGAFKKGVFVLAIHAGVPIVPIAIEGAAVMVPKRGWRPRPAHVRMSVGKPIETDGLSENSRDALMTQVRDTIIALHVGIGGRGGATLPLRGAELKRTA